MSFIGNPSYGGPKKNNYKIGDGSNLYRILPPCGTLAAKGQWASRYESIHWGYKGSSGRMRVFRCPLETKNQGKGKPKLVIKACAECDLIAQRDADYKKRLKELTEGQGMGLEAAQERLKPLGDWLYAHNRDSKIYLNVMKESGEIGKLAVPFKSFEALKLAIAEVVKKGIDPIRVDQGVFFDFNRSGKGNQTLHRVSVVTEDFQQNGETFSRIKRAPLTEEVLKRMETEAYDLGDMFRTVTTDDVARLVASGGEAAVVDSIFSAPESATDKATPGVGSSVGTFVVEEPDEDEIIAQVAAASTLPTIPEVVSEEDALDAEIKALMAKKAAQKAAPKQEAPLPAATRSTATMSNAEFLETYGKAAKQ
jgi:hypothetical protein